MKPFAFIVLVLFPSLIIADPLRHESGPLDEEYFEPLLSHSPFTRDVHLTDTFVLTGTARIDGQLSITVLDTETGLSAMVSAVPNTEGWYLVEIANPEDLKRAVASIARSGGIVARIRYSEERVQSTTQRLRFESKARADRKVAAARAQSGGSGAGHEVPKERVAMLRKIDTNELPKGYNPGAGNSREESHRLHQTYVDQRLKGMSDRQRGLVGQMWKQKTTVDPGMSNRGASFVRIMEHIAENEKR